MINRFEAYCDEDEISKVIMDSESEEWIDARGLGIQMLRDYHAEYNGDKNWDVISIETPFQIEIPHPLYPDVTVITFTSTWDGVFRDTNDKLIKLMEHKTSKDNKTGHLSLDDQGGSYWAAANFILRDRGLLGPKDSIDGIQYNFLKKVMPDDRPQNEFGQYLNKNGSVSKIQPGPRFVRELVRRNKVEQATQIRRIASEALLMDQFRDPARPQLPIIKNPTRDCQWDCNFFTMCELQERGDDWEEYKKAVYTRKNPYDRYRKQA